MPGAAAGAPPAEILAEYRAISAVFATLPETNLDDATDPTVFGIAYILGEGYAAPNSRWSVACITNGGHVNGAATIWSVDPT